MNAQIIQIQRINVYYYYNTGYFHKCLQNDGSTVYNLLKWFN